MAQPDDPEGELDKIQDNYARVPVATTPPYIQPDDPEGELDKIQVVRRASPMLTIGRGIDLF